MKFRNMSGTYLTPSEWINYCNKNGWNHLWYAVSWSYRKYLIYPKTRRLYNISKRLGYNPYDDDLKN